MTKQEFQIKLGEIIEYSQYIEQLPKKLCRLKLGGDIFENVMAVEEKIETDTFGKLIVELKKLKRYVEKVFY